jgi:hypothetical protein
MYMAVVGSRSIPIACITSGKTKTQVSCIANVATGVTPDRYTAGQWNVGIGATIARTVGSHRGGTENAK